MKTLASLLLLVAFDVLRDEADAHRVDLTGPNIKVYQISTLEEHKAERAINGLNVVEGCWDWGFSHTKNEKSPWWRLDLGAMYFIDVVSIMPRSGKWWDSVLKVFLGTEIDKIADAWKSQEKMVPGGKTVYFKCPPHSAARFITIQRQRPEWHVWQALCLCDVQVAGTKVHVECAQPTLRYGHASYQDTTIGSIVTYRCNEGFQLKGAATATCRGHGQTGQWSWHGQRKPKCTPISCGTPKNPANGEHKGKSYTFGLSVTYMCNKGHRMYGQSSSRCTESGWSPGPPTCRAISCATPKYLANGYHVGNSYTFGSSVTYMCNQGHRMYGQSSSRCTESGWSPGPPTCRAIICGSVTVPSNCQVTGEGFTVGSIRHYTCHNGYNLNGAETITCKEHYNMGKWSAPVPTCQIHSCGAPPSLEHGQIDGTDHTSGSTVFYTCNTGYRLEGLQTRVCHVSGWSGSPPKCNSVECRDPGPLVNGRASSGRFIFCFEMTYTCNPGYSLRGSSTSICGSDGRWSHRKPECQLVKCKPVYTPRHGSKEGDVFEYPNIIRFSCFPGYRLVGSGNTKCQQDGTWSDSPPTCKACEIGFYKDTLSSGTCIKCPAMSTTVSEASSQKEHCTCLKGYNGPLGGPCSVVSCEPLSPPEDGTMTHCKTNIGAECVFTCNRGYRRTAGSSRRMCTKTGWTGSLVSCTACPKDTYTMFHGADSCTPCPRDTESRPGQLGQRLQSCVCKESYKGPPGGPCEDFDECSQDPCDGTCVNTEGSFRCQCDIPGYVLAVDNRTCIIDKSCKKLEETPRNGSLKCRHSSQNNAYTCYINCKPGFFFVSGINNYLTCGEDTQFEWSHQRVNKTARIPGCTREFYVDVDLPITLKHAYIASCGDLTLSSAAFTIQLDLVVNSISTCKDKCNVHDVTLSCTDKKGGKTEAVVEFKLMLTNVRPNEVPYNCTRRCRQENMREILLSMRNLSKILEEKVKENPELFNLGTSNSPTQNIFFGRPDLLCEPGKVLTVNRLCVPCDRGHYLPARDRDTCLPCPKGTFQDKKGQMSCKKCLEGSTTIDEGSDHPTMCNQKVPKFSLN